MPIRDVHETFWAETETRPETHNSETVTKPRDVETETASLVS